MQNNFQINKTLVWLELSNIHKCEDYRVYNSKFDKGLNTSIKLNNVIEPFTVIKKMKKYILINGFRRHDYLEEISSGDKLVPVWVITDDLTEAQIQMLILDLARVRQKGYVEILNEYHLYNKLLPNNQGKKNVEKYRSKDIADRIGTSVSTLRRLLKIDRIKPSLLTAVDSGVITLKKAEVDAKTIERERNKADEKFDNEEVDDDFSNDEDSGQDQPRTVKRSYKDKLIDLNILPECCPTCNRNFSNITWDEIPKIFNKKRKPEENQVDWLRQNLTNKNK